MHRPAGRGQRYAGHDAVQPAQAGHSARHLRPRVPRGRLHRLNARPSRQEPCMSTQSAAAAPGRRSRPEIYTPRRISRVVFLVVGEGARAGVRQRARACASEEGKMGPCTWSLPDGGAPWRMGSRTADAAAGAAGVVTCADYERVVPARWALSSDAPWARVSVSGATSNSCLLRSPRGCFPGEAWKSPGLGFLIHCMNSLHRRNSSICRGRESVRVDVNMRHNVM